MKNLFIDIVSFVGLTYGVIHFSVENFNAMLLALNISLLFMLVVIFVFKNYVLASNAIDKVTIRVERKGEDNESD